MLKCLVLKIPPITAPLPLFLKIVLLLSEKGRDRNTNDESSMGYLLHGAPRTGIERLGRVL